MDTDGQRDQARLTVRSALEFVRRTDGGAAILAGGHVNDRTDLTRALVPDRPVKVFGIGLHKTSTSSLANALYILGYHVGGTFATGDFADQAQLEAYVIEAAGRYDAIQDMPWPAFYRMLDEHFPGSKFVLTVRDPDRWVSSVVTHFGRKDISSHEYVYGVPTAEGHEQVYLEHFRRHSQDVQQYFADRPDDLLVMDIGAGQGWAELCAFLDVPVPDLPFPHQNPASGRRRGRYQRRIRREIEARARGLGVSRRRIEGDRVRAESAYEAIQLLCRRVDALVAMVDQLDAGQTRQRLEGMLRVWLEDHLTWLSGVGAIDETQAVRSDLDTWQLGQAWGRMALSTRCWAGDLMDDGFGVLDSEGRDARDRVRRCLDLGIARYDAIVAAFDPGRELDRPDDGLRRL